jgi:hypothetical protein
MRLVNPKASTFLLQIFARRDRQSTVAHNSPVAFDIVRDGRLFKPIDGNPESARAARTASMAAHSAYVIWYMRGRGDDGELFLMSDGMGVGYGARPFADGNDAVYLVAQIVRYGLPLLHEIAAIDLASPGPPARAGLGLNPIQPRRSDHSCKESRA